MQILGSKLISAEVGKMRLRLLLSDGRNTISYTTLTIDSNKFLNGYLADNTIVKLKKYAISTLNTEKGDR